MQDGHEVGRAGGVSTQGPRGHGGDAHPTPPSVLPGGRAAQCTATFQGRGEAAGATVRAPLLRGQGTQRLTTLVPFFGGEGNMPEATITATPGFFPLRAGFSSEPRTQSCAWALRGWVWLVEVAAGA